MDPKGLARVEEIFQQQIEEGRHPGATLAVYRYGQLVLDLQGGSADVEAGMPVTRETMFVLYSSTKPLTATCLHLLWERGKFAWDDPRLRVLARVCQERQRRGYRPADFDSSRGVPRHAESHDVGQVE